MLFFQKRLPTAWLYFLGYKKYFSGYISGQLTDAFIMAVLFSVCFYFGKIKYAVFIGIISGFFNLIPYIGAVAAAGFVCSCFPYRRRYFKSHIFSFGYNNRSADRLGSYFPESCWKKRTSSSCSGYNVAFGFGSLGGVWAMIFAVPVTAVLKLNFDRFINFQKKKRRFKIDI